MQAAWDALSAAYQDFHALDTHVVAYSAWAPSERELRLLGDVSGLSVLEIGCGGGQAAIALARQGAQVTGLDFSAAQLLFARELAAQARVAVAFVQGKAEDLAPVATGACDLALSINTMQYVDEIAASLASCYRVLRPGGRLVFSLDHPLRTVFFEEGELSVLPTRSYFDAAPLRWRWRSTAVTLQTYHRTVGEWVDLLAAAGLQLLRIVEPPPPAETLDAAWPPDDALAPLRLLPHTIIFVAQKP
jgi:SAM-dependent methyltransferase